MTVNKIAITMDEDLLQQVDRLISEHRYPNRSRAIQDAVREQLARMNRSRLARESARLDSAFERKMADEALGELSEWPQY